MTVSLTGHMDVPLEQIDAVTAALRLHIKLTQAEPGCLHFLVTPHPVVPGRFMVEERFVDPAAFDAHQTRTSASAWGELTRKFKRDYVIESDT